MNELQFAQAHLGNYKIKTEEIIAEICPVCGGGSKRDKHTFYLNQEKHTYFCHRGSCNASGTFHDLAKLYGEVADYMADIKKQHFEKTVTKKTYIKPKMPLKTLNKNSIAYLSSRGINEATMSHFVLKNDAQGNIVFPYFDEKGEHVCNKIRISREFIKGKDNMKIWQETGGKPVLLNMNRVDVNKPVVITEGEWDCMSVYEAGFPNVVSVPFGTNNMDWIHECWEWLESCKEFVIWFDSDEPGRKASREVIRKLGAYRCREIEGADGYKDANEVLCGAGKDKVLSIVMQAEYVPIEHLKKLSDVQMKKSERILFGIPFLDYELGGCKMGELTVWTGKRGGGKSTILNQTIGDSVEQRCKVFIYSGELENSRVAQWLHLQLAGKDNIVKYQDELTRRTEYGVAPKVIPAIKTWYDDYIYIYGDEGSNGEDYLLEVMEYAYRRHNVKRFLIDNLKTLRFRNDNDFYRAQGLLINRLKTFCRSFNVHIDLVVHPRKTNSDELADEDVGGTSDIIDLADNVISVSRITKKMKDHADTLTDDRPGSYKNLIMDNDTILKVLKNRSYGDTDRKAYFKFDTIRKRISDSIKDKEYEWHKYTGTKCESNQTYFEINRSDCPF